MTTTLHENIRNLRKERRMTQEQLSEALGVTVGAVHKWEKGLSTPDIGYIMSMANLFGVSTDVLLGYEWRSGDTGKIVNRIRQLREEKHWQESIEEGERAVRRFPNHFEIVYQCGLSYLGLCRTFFEKRSDTTEEQDTFFDRGVELLEHAIELLSQNSDPEISMYTIYREIAEIHELHRYIDSAIQTLEKGNICGINNARISDLYAQFIHDDEKAIYYLGRAYTNVMKDLSAVISSVMNYFYDRKDYDAAIACMRWEISALRGIQSEDEITEFDRFDAQEAHQMGLICGVKGDLSQTKELFRFALAKAIRYDTGPVVRGKLAAVLEVEDAPVRRDYRRDLSTVEMLEWETPRAEDAHVLKESMAIREVWEEVKKEFQL